MPHPQSELPLLRPGLDTVFAPLASLEEELAARLMEMKGGDPLAPVYVLVGGTLLRPYLQRRLATLTGGHVNVHFRTPAELALELGEAAHVAAGRAPLPPLASRVLAGEIARGSTGYFQPVAESAGFATALHRLVREMAQAKTDAGQLGRARLGNAPKHADLATLFAGYETKRASFYGPDECYATVDPTQLPAVGLLVYGIVDPTRALLDVLRQLAQTVPVTVFLPHTASGPDRAHERFRRELGAPESPHDADEPAATPLAHLHARLFTPPTDSAPEASGVRLLSAPDPVREVRSAARACLAWGRDGIPFHEMVVAYRHSEPYRPLIEAIFREAGIPIYLHEGTPLAERPLGRQAIALVDLVGGALERRAVTDFVGEAAIPKHTRERYGAFRASRWDTITRKAGILAGRDQWMERLKLYRESHVERYGAEPPAWLADDLATIDALVAFITDFDDRLSDHPALAGFADHLAYVRRLFGDYLRDADPILDALDGLARLDTLTGPITFDRFRDIAIAVVEGMRSEDALGARAGAFARRGVNVLDVNSLALLRFSGVAILGLVERAFPAPPRQDPLLLDQERRVLAGEHGIDLPLRAFGPDREPLQFALAVHAATQRLHLSFPRSDAPGGKVQLPSSFFRAAAATLIGHHVRVEDVDRLPAWFFARERAAQIGAPSIADALTTTEYLHTLLEKQPALARAMLAGNDRLRRAREMHRARWDERVLTVYDGALSADAMEGHWTLGANMSASNAETYAQCPFRYFLGRVLGLRELNEPEAVERVDALTRGSLVHEILERFLSECGDDDIPSHPRRSAHLARLHVIGEEECAAVEARGLTGFPLIWRYDRESILEDLVTWYDAELAEASGFTHGAFELRFGPAYRNEETSPHSVVEPLVLKVGEHELRIAGKIDRVNWRPDTGSFRVIDYKTGRVWNKDGELRQGQAIQLPFYLHAVAHALGLPVERGEAQYFYVTRAGGFARVRFTGTDLVDRREDLDTILRTLTEGVASGLFPTRPEKTKCNNCDFNSLCPAGRVALTRRKADDPRQADLAALEGIE